MTTKTKPEPREQLDAFGIETKVQRESPDEAPVKKKIRRWHTGMPKEDGHYEVRADFRTGAIDTVTIRDGKLLSRLCEHSPPCPRDPRESGWSVQHRRLEND